MAAKRETRKARSSKVDQKALDELLGYLNFSSGKPDPRFERNFNRIQAAFGIDRPVAELRELLLDRLGHLQKNSPPFADSRQGEAVIRLALGPCLAAYRAHHADLLFHLSEIDFQQPFFLARLFEAGLEQGPPWDDEERIAASALDRLNDFLGYRPLAVLEDGRLMQPYPHERFQPVPIYIRNAGVADGPYRELVECVLALFQETPEDVLHASHFSLELLDELSVDMRAHDHMHPVNKRTNYMFGEWDPHLVDTQGRYRRFVVRRIILDSLVKWVDSGSGDRKELLYDASAALCGTMLMASAISGSSQATHDSSVTLTSLLPKVAKLRDDFYDRLLKTASGSRARRLEGVAKRTRQPFGNVRQQLNMQLAGYGARQVQYRHVAQLYARMGYADAARRQAALIPSASARFETEITWRITAAQSSLDDGEPQAALTLVREIEDLLKRGVECGAFIDPWNILGFQSLFPLFQSREDSVPDHRAETLLSLVNETFDVYARGLSEATVQGKLPLAEAFSDGFRALGESWDRYATEIIEDLPRIAGEEGWESARAVAAALAQWKTAGEAAGDISFWRPHAEGFQSAKAYALVVDTLLEAGDHLAARGLLMEWLNQADLYGLEAGPHSVYGMLVRWMQLVVDPQRNQRTVKDPWVEVRRLFDYLEANSGELWNVPTLDQAADREPEDFAELAADDAGDEAADPEDLEADESSLFEAAYDSVTYRDSAADGQFGEVSDGGFAYQDSEFDLVIRRLESHLLFVQTLAKLWQIAAAAFARGLEKQAGGAEQPEAREEALRGWHMRARELQRELSRLLREVARETIGAPSGEHDSNVEYDMQLQAKVYLLHLIIATQVACRNAQRCLAGILPDEPQKTRGVIARVYRGVLTGDAGAVRQHLPVLLRKVARSPLLYVPIEAGGNPAQVRSVRNLQTLFEFLFSQLPRMGLLRETWQVLRTVYRMERSSKPRGQAVTEFDRLFHSALRSTLECVVRSSNRWRSGRLLTAELIEFVNSVTERYLALWNRHSSTMRLSSVEELNHDATWRKVKRFIERYGADFFQVRMLTLGNIRAVLHSGLDEYLNYLASNQDPLHPVRLLDDLAAGEADREEAVTTLRLIYSCLVEKFERFIEYNTTTTQSDYGEKMHCLLDFLRLEAEYERSAWALAPAVTTQEVLTRLGKPEAAELWKRQIRRRTRQVADEHLKSLAELEASHGMHLPALSDRIHEQFVKPLAVYRMVALVPHAVEDAGKHRESDSFERLQSEINAYLESTSGSNVDIPPWLWHLEREVDRVVAPDDEPVEPGPVPLELPQTLINLTEMRRQLKAWDERL